MKYLELYWLTLTVFMTSVFWVPYIINRLIELKPLNALMYREVDPKPVAAWANRMAHAHKNAVENLVIFAPLVLTITILDVSNATSVAACMIYFYARAAHYIVYTFGVPFLRTVTFFIGFICQIMLVSVILGAL